jgi:hypothetical protein
LVSARSSEQLLLTGTLTTFRRRCGKPNCRCATGDPHEGPALRYLEGGRTKLITLAATDVAEVAAALARYEKARATLDAAAAEGLAALRSQLATRRGGRRA